MASLAANLGDRYPVALESQRRGSGNPRVEFRIAIDVPFHLDYRNCTLHPLQNLDYTHHMNGHIPHL